MTRIFSSNSARKNSKQVNCEYEIR